VQVFSSFFFLLELAIEAFICFAIIARDLYVARHRFIYAPSLACTSTLLYILLPAMALLPHRFCLLTFGSLIFFS
jgi:hypothetical protein